MKKILLYLAMLITISSFSQSVSLQSFGPQFDNPVDIKPITNHVSLLDWDELLVVEQKGVIQVLNSDGTVQGTPFLDIQNDVYFGGERGLLGVTTHPTLLYNELPIIYINYTDNNEDTVIAQYYIEDPNSTGNAGNYFVDLNSKQILLTIDQPYSNHNGGSINFGPDGHLYIGMGDGGSGGDPQNFSQNTSSLLGKMLRIEVDPFGSAPYYSIPNDNPYGDEIWAIGLRNPWKFSFDKDTGDLWIADVGQNVYEEINLVSNNPPNVNYGWRCYEGNVVYNTSSNCPNSSELTFPVGTYSHSNDGAFKCSITGGYAYRGSQLSGMDGVYFFADYCSQEIGMLSYDTNTQTWTRDLVFPNASGQWVTFGQDLSGELYVGSHGGQIYKITDAALSLDSIEESKLEIYPNPTSGIINLDNNGEVLNITIYDINGRIVVEHENYSLQQLNISELNNGIYFMKINNLYTQKIIKN
tara:strand:- start:3304 stop:4710 length:1407 start_codon:yes stop_codon:yes gene_type:complete